MLSARGEKERLEELVLAQHLALRDSDIGVARLGGPNPSVDICLGHREARTEATGGEWVIVQHDCTPVI